MHGQQTLFKMFRLLLNHLQALLKYKSRLTIFIVHSGNPNSYIKKCTCCKSTMSVDFVIYRAFHNVLRDFKNLL